MATMKLLTMGRRVVPPSGSLDLKYMLVGEAPGEEEERQLEPFVGSSGRVLINTLGSVGLSRNMVHLTNVVRVRPAFLDGKKNNIKEFVDIPSDRKKAVTETELYRQHRDFLIRDIKKSKAEMIILLGAVPLWAVLGMRDIQQKRGYVYHAFGKRILPTRHPAASLYGDHQSRYMIMIDLMKARRIVEKNINYPERDLILNPTFEEAKLHLESILKKKQQIGFDIEISNREVSHISFAWNHRDAMSIEFKRNLFTVEEEAELWSLIARILYDKRIVKVAENISFDYGFLYDKYGITIRNFEDTMIKAAVVAPELPKGLNYLASVYTYEPFWKEDLHSDDPELVRRYSATDSVVLPEINAQLDKELKRLGNTDTAKSQTSIVEPLLYMSRRGVRIDEKKRAKMEVEYDDKIKELKERLNSIAGEDLNPNSFPQLKKYFYITKGLAPYKNRKSGKITCDETALRRLSRKGIEEAGLVLRIRHLVTVRGTFLRNLQSPTGRTITFYNPVGTVNGRISSSQGIFKEGVTMQNLPREIRSVLCADPGYVIYSLDLAQAEIYVMAYICPEHNMIQAFEEGVKIHAKTAGYIYGKAPSEVSKEEWSSGISQKSEYGMGKEVNLAFNYGMGYRTFSLRQEIPEAIAKKYQAHYHAVYPGIRQGHSWMRHALSSDGKRLTNPFGRTRKFMGPWGEKLFNQAYNFIPQSTVADIINRWGLSFIYYDPRFKDVELLNQIHDEIVFQIPLSLGVNKHKELLRLITESLSQPITWRGTKFSIPTEIKMGLNLGELEEVELGQSFNRTFNKLKDA